MNYDELAFFNQQLAAMLRDGIPLEGALLRLCGEMRPGTLRSELELLAADLSKGVPLAKAAQARKLPDLYRQLLQVGVASNDLPGILTLLADYYQRRNLIWVRLKGLMVYPLIVLVCALIVSCLLSFLSASAGAMLFSGIPGFTTDSARALAIFSFTPLLLGLVLVASLVAAASPGLRRNLRWRLPALKEASLAQTGAAVSLLLKSGVPLNDALALVAQLEEGTPAGREISLWREKLSAGNGKFSEMASGGEVFPPMFVWMVSNAGEDLGAGFQRASEIYQARSGYRTEMLLYSALPCAVVALGLMIIIQVQPVAAQVVVMLDKFSGD
jgi:type II secretory pathway component PulF